MPLRNLLVQERDSGIIVQCEETPYHTGNLGDFVHRDRYPAGWVITGGNILNVVEDNNSSFFYDKELCLLFEILKPGKEYW